jgi:hypothetical protein
VGRPSRRGNLGELQNLPTKDLQNKIPLVKSFRSTRGTKWWSGSEDLVEEITMGEDGVEERRPWWRSMVGEGERIKG